MMLRLLATVAIFAASNALAQAPPSSPWPLNESLVDPTNGCRVYEPRPQDQAGVEVRWAGACVNGWAEGTGTLRWLMNGKPDGDYVGPMRKGLLHGRGVRTWPSGTRYEGDFVENTRTGQGSYIWSTGDRYDGGFVNGQREGHGVFKWIDGTRYEGMWAAGLPNGQGTKFVTDGRRFTGNWTNGCFRQGDTWSSAAVPPEQCGFR